MIACACGSVVLEKYEEVDDWTVFSMIFNLFTCLALIFTAGIHLWFVFTNSNFAILKKNRTENVFDLGFKRNLRNSFGKQVFSYFFPIDYEVDGVFYPVSVKTIYEETVFYENLVIYQEKNNN